MNTQIKISRLLKKNLNSKKHLKSIKFNFLKKNIKLELRHKFNYQNNINKGQIKPKTNICKKLNLNNIIAYVYRIIKQLLLPRKYIASTKVSYTIPNIT